MPWIPIDDWLEHTERDRGYQQRPDIDDYVPAWRRTKDDQDWPPGGVIEDEV